MRRLAATACRERFARIRSRRCGGPRGGREARRVLLRVYRQSLRHEDLEDCYGQATLELLQRARRDGGFQERAHIANALEQKLCSRIDDRRRALAGRSAVESALAGALPFGELERGGVDVPDPRAGVEDVALARLELWRLLRLARRLTRDQRLVLACQLQLDESTCELLRGSAGRRRNTGRLRSAAALGFACSRRRPRMRRWRIRLCGERRRREHRDAYQPHGTLMGLGRRPREVYRTFSEQELLDGEPGIDEQPGDPAAEQDPLSGQAQVGSSGNLAARSRAILLTALATFLGLAVGLAAVTLIDGGGLPNLGGATPGVQRGPRADGRRRAPGSPDRPGREGSSAGPFARAPRSPGVAVAAKRPPVSHRASANAPWSLAHADCRRRRTSHKHTSPARRGRAGAGSGGGGLSLVAREAGSEFGFER